MIRVNSIVILLFCAFVISGQNKGIKTVIKDTSSGKTRALIIGISDYQHLPDLGYADKDALAFYDYLKSESGGKVDSQNIHILINDRATSAQVNAQLDWLIEESKSGDRVYIYFSGHGDAQSNLTRTPGYLLCWDSPEKSYASGNLSVYILNDYIYDLNSRNIKTILVVDACRAGKLSGNYVNGALLTNDLVSKSIGHELRLLSCGPNQYSIEGEQWGGGRGVFSYHLTLGLYGKADKDKDEKVTIAELTRYLEDQVSNEVSPQNQIPMVVAEDRDEIISYVDMKMLSKQITNKAHQEFYMGMIEAKSLEDEVIKALDTSMQRYYQLFKQSLKDKILLKPENACAEYYYQILSKAPGMKKLYAFMKRNYAAVLQDDAQQVMNQFLEVDVRELRMLKKERIEKYKEYPELIARAAELLGDKNYHYNTLIARKYLFEALLLYLDNLSLNSETNAKLTIDNFQLSIQAQKDNPVSYFYLSNFYATTKTSFKNRDSCVYYSNKAIEYAESWILPYAYQIYNLSRYFEDTNIDEGFISKAMKVDSNDIFLIKGIAAQYFYEGNVEKSILYYLRGLSIDSTDATMWISLGACYQESNNYVEAEKYFRKSIIINPKQFNAYNFLGYLLFKLNHFQEAEENYKIAIENNSKNVQVRGRLVLLYLTKGQLDLAEQQCKELEKLDPKGWRHLYYQACVSSLRHDNDKAVGLLEKAILANMSDAAEIKSTKFLDSIRALDAFNTLMKKYFPNDF
jgi:Flp pilus assembly protein TadD